MTLLTDKHTCKGIQIQRQILGKNFTSWVNSGLRAHEDKDKQMHKYTDTQIHKYTYADTRHTYFK